MERETYKHTEQIIETAIQREKREREMEMKREAEMEMEREYVIAKIPF